MTKIQNAVAKQNNNNGISNSSIKDLINSDVMRLEFKKALPSMMTAERFLRIANSALSTNPKLASCSRQTFLGALMTSAQLGLEVNTPLGQAYLIPYYNGKTKNYDCQFQIGYKGLIELAYRSGDIKSIQAHTVYNNDEFIYELGLEPTIKHKPAMTNRGEPVFYYAVIKLKDGGDCFAVASKEDIINHKNKFSKMADSGAWLTNFDEMAKKTVLKQALKYAPLKADFMRQVATDETIKETISDDMTIEVNIADYNEETEQEQQIEVAEDKKEQQKVADIDDLINQ